jgi:hypothetical protein
VQFQTQGIFTHGVEGGDSGIPDLNFAYQDTVMSKRQVYTQIALGKGAAEQGAALGFIVCGQCGRIVFTHGKVAVGDIGITGAATALSALGGQYDMSAGSGFQQILLRGAFETKLFPVAGGQFNRVSIHVLFELQKKLPPERLTRNYERIRFLAKIKKITTKNTKSTKFLVVALWIFSSRPRQLLLHCSTSCILAVVRVLCGK